MDEFDWAGEDVVVKPVAAIAVYFNEKGEIVVRQQDPMRDEDSFIYFPKSQAKAIAKAILDAAKE